MNGGRSPSQRFPPPHVYRCPPRAITPYNDPSLRPVVPMRGYWAHRTPPHAVAVRPVYVGTPPPFWYPLNPTVYNGYQDYGLCLPPTPQPLTPQPLPPPSSSSPCVYSRNNCPLRPFYPKTKGSIQVQPPFPAIPAMDSARERFLTNTINPSESPTKQRPNFKPSLNESFGTPRYENHTEKWQRPNVGLHVNKVEVQIKEDGKNYKYKGTDHDLHPEILATWRKSLNKSNDNSRTHEVKIEICLKKEERSKKKKVENAERVKMNKQEGDLKISLCSKEVGAEKYSVQRKKTKKKMSPTNKKDSEQSTSKEKLNLSPILSSKDEKHLVSKDTSSGLRFTPVRTHKVHKKKKDDTHKKLLKRKNCYTQIREVLESCSSREKCEKSSSGSSASNSDVDEITDSCRKSNESDVQDSRRSNCNTNLNRESYRETYSSRNEHSQSSERSSFVNRSSSSHRTFSSSPFKSPSSFKTSNQDSISDANSSIYVTPEGTPFSMRSTESSERQSHGSKRRLSDYLNEDSPSANSSITSSVYFTPESSPSQSSSAKRRKIRWSDSFSPEDAPYLKFRRSTSSFSDQTFQPELIGYQMVGDSQFCRFGQQLLGLERVPMDNCPGRIGICVSGQTITDLHRRVRENFYPISDKIIVMIGTNDFLRNVDIRTMCDELTALIRTLQKSATNIILLTLPPIPKLEKKNSAKHFEMLEAYNSHIRSLENGNTLRIADISPLFVTSTPHQRCRMHLFELYFFGKARRLDLIHLNRLGLEIIRKYILDKFL